MNCVAVRHVSVRIMTVLGVDLLIKLVTMLDLNIRRMHKRVIIEDVIHRCIGFTRLLLVHLIYTVSDSVYNMTNTRKKGSSRKKLKKISQKVLERAIVSQKTLKIGYFLAKTVKMKIWRTFGVFYSISAENASQVRQMRLSDFR